MNIRKFLKGSILLLVVVLAMVGCSKKDNPFEPVTDSAMSVSASDLINAGAVTITPALGSALTDLDPANPGVQAEIIITFPVYMEASTVTLTNIQVQNIDTATATITYYPELKKAVIYGTWGSGTYWCMVTLTTGLRAKGGGYIDGNGNGKGDGAPYDNVRHYVSVGSPAAGTEPDIIHPALVGGSPYGGNINPIYPQFYCRFNARDIDSNLVRSNFSVKDSTGRSISLKSDGTLWNGSSWYVYFRTTGSDSILTSNAQYTITVTLNAIHDTSIYKNNAIWQNYGYVADIPDAYWPFRTSTTAAGDYTPLGLSSVNVNTTELVITFNDSLDMTTANSSTIKVYKTNGTDPTAAIYGRIYTQPSDIAARRVRFTLENAPLGSGSYRLYIFKEIKDNSGWMLDSNGNGIGGEEGIPGWNIQSDDYNTNFSR